MKQLRLSPSTLNIYLECRKCFWLQFNRGIKRPRGIFPSLPGGMDNVIKSYFDTYRVRGELPPELREGVEGVLVPELDLIRKWRDWRTGLSYTDSSLNAVLFGALDDCVLDEGFYVPLDYKTRGYAPGGDSERYYGNQLNCYSLLLEENGYRVKNHAYLVYYYPDSVGEDGVVKFNVQPVRLNTELRRAKKTFEGAVELLRGDMPPDTPGCEYCRLRGISLEETPAPKPVKREPEPFPGKKTGPDAKPKSRRRKPASDKNGQIDLFK